MKVLIVNRFFGGAQIPTGRMAQDVARSLVEEGHEVTALASSGEYVGAARRADGIQHTANGIRLEEVRVPKWMPRALVWLWFTWQARQRIPRMDWDVCVLMTDPPLLPLLAARAKAAERLRDCGTRGPQDATRRVTVWLMDLYPEALAASGWIGTGNPIYRWYFSKRQRALAASDLLVCLGEAQRERLETKRQPEVGGLRPETGDGLHGNQLVKDQEQGEVEVRRQGAGDRRQAMVRTEALQQRNNATPRPPLTQRVRTVVVPPWDDRGSIALAREESLRNLALYAGNLGEAHCFEEILAAAPHLPGDWTIRFAARGAKLSALLSKLRSDEWRVTGDESGSASAFAAANDSCVTSGSLKLTDLKIKTAGAVVHVSGYASEEETPGLLAAARVHLITMSPGWEGIVVPSKLYGCIRTGRPVLFIGPENADTAREICANDWGKVLPPGVSGQEVAAAILELAARETRSVRPQQGAAAVAGELIRLAEGDG